MQRIVPSRPNSYTGAWLDRAAHLRLDTAWLEAARLDAKARYTLAWRGKALIVVKDGPRACLVERPDIDAPWVFLGLLDGEALFAADLSAMSDPHELVARERGTFMELRDVTMSLPAQDAVILATARGMLHWRATHLHCARCGGVNAPARGGWVYVCERCGTEAFPRTDAAVIMLVVRGDKLLLGQSHRFPTDLNWYSTLAGFVEPGEGLEDAVRREVWEEVGVKIGEVAYHSSQPWPFPASLMLGFYAEALTEEITLEAEEMRDARWFSREDILRRAELGFELPPGSSIARRLIDDWLEAGAG